MEVPERQRLHREVEDRRAAPQLGEAEDAIEPPHACRRWLSLGGQPLEEFRQSRRATRRGDGVLEDGAISAERVLSSARPIERRPEVDPQSQTTR